MKPAPGGGAGRWGGVPAVSVLMPVYDEEPHLEEALASVLGQDLADLEVVAVDDGSADGSGRLLDSTAARDSRVRVVHTPHRGLVAALQTGLEVCQAPLIARMDADDWMLPGRLRAQVAALAASPHLGVVCGGMQIRRADGRSLGSGMRRFQAWQNSLRSHEEMRRDLFVEAPLGHPTAMMRSEVLRGAGGYRDCGWPEDYDLWMRLFLADVRFLKLEEPPVVHVWRDGPGRISARSPTYGADAFRALKIHYLEASHLAGAEEVVVWGAGRVGKPFARALQRSGFRVTAFVDLHPRKIGKRIHGAPVLAPAELATRRGTPIVVAVGAPGARDEIRQWLDAAGCRELIDYVCVA